MLHTGLAAPDGFEIYGYFLGALGAWPGHTLPLGQTGRVWHPARCLWLGQWLQTGELCPCLQETWASLTTQGLPWPVAHKQV